MKFLPILFYLWSYLFIFYYTKTHFSWHIFVIYHARGKEFRKYCPQVFDSEEVKYSDEWCKARLLIAFSNELFNNVADIYLKFGDYSMSGIIFVLHRRVTCLYCPLFPKIRNHWSQSSRLWPVIYWGLDIYIDI